MRQFVLACIHPRIDQAGRVQAMVIALVCVFCATPFQAAAAVMCSLPERYDWVECCSSEATIVNKSLLSQQKLAHGYIEGTLALKLRVSYSAVDGRWSDFDCAKLDVTVRHGVGRKHYRHIVPYTNGVSDYIEDTFTYLFEPPFRQSDVYVESIACKMPKIMLDGRSCGSDEEQEKNERERRAEQREKERKRLVQQRRDDERQRLADQQRREQERQWLADQQRREQERQRLADQQRREQERQWLAQLQREQRRQQHDQEQGGASGLQQFLTGFTSGMAIVRGLAGLVDGANSPGFTGQGAGSGSITEACQEAQVKVARRLASQSSSADNSQCGIRRSYAQTLEGVRRELGSAGCPASALREYDRVIAETRRQARMVCN